MSKDEPDCDKLREMLSVLLTKEETPMDKLEAEIANTQEYQDRVLTWKAHATRLIQTARDSVRVRVSNSSSVRLLNNQTAQVSDREIQRRNKPVARILVTV